MSVDDTNNPADAEESETETPAGADANASADVQAAAEAPPQAQEELLSAFSHFKNAAGILLDKAVNDGALERAAASAERALGQFTASAEPLAKQLSTEIAKVGRIVGETLTDAIQAQTQPFEPAQDEGEEAEGSSDVPPSDDSEACDATLPPIDEPSTDS